MARTRTGALVALAGVLLLLVGLFSGIGRCAVPGAPCPSPGPDEILAYSGIALLIVGIALLLRAGMRGSPASVALAALGAIPATWFLYELGRQSGCPLLEEPETQSACLRAFGEMTAPVLSVGVGLVVFVVGWLKLRGRAPSSDIPER
jgi:hypothetical protein